MAVKNKYDRKTYIQRGIVFLFFSLFLFYGLLVFDDYGVSWDEPVQRYHSLVTYNDVVLGDTEYKTTYIDTEDLPPLEEYGSNYGVILQLPMVLIEHLTGFQMSYLEIFQMRHLYNFLWFFIAAIFFYKLCMILTEQNWVVSLAGTAMFVLCPRILADSFYNVKDMLCHPMFTISMYYGVRLIRQIKIKDLILFCIFSALCTTVRVVGGVIVVACVAILLTKGICQHHWKKYILSFGAIVLIFFAGFVLMTPKSWGDLWSTLWNTIKTFSSYTTWNAQVVYLGESVWAWELPWHYLFVWIGISVPLAYLILAIGGFFLTFYHTIRLICKKKWSDQIGVNCFLGMILVIPFAYVVIMRPVLYNGWRHFYFVYPAIVAFAVIGLNNIVVGTSKKWIKIIAWGGLALSLLQTGIWIVKNHPYEYVYFSPWIRSYAVDNFDMDYWCVTEEECLQYILDTDDSSDIAVYSSPNYTWLFDDAKGENRLRAVSTPDTAEYVVAWGGDFEESYLFAEEKEITVDGAVLRSVYKRVYEPITRFVLQETSENTEYTLNNVVWDKQEDTTGEYWIYTASLVEEIPTDLIAVITSDDSMIEAGELQVLISGDGENWYDLSEAPKYSYDSNRISAECMVHELKYIRIICPQIDDAAERSWEVVLCGYEDDVQGIEAKGNLVIDEITTNIAIVDPSTGPQYMKDGNLGTRWTTSHQQAGMYMELRLNGTYQIDKVSLRLGESPWDYPRNLLIYVSVDGEEWTQLEMVTADNETFCFSPVECSYLRFELGPMEETVNSNWSVYEVELYSVVE